jgi:hypothetical protein
MKMRKRVAIGAAGLGVIAVLAVGGVAMATGGEDGEGHVTGPEADAATSAALAATKGGTANAVERDSENGATWEVEVTRNDGKTVDVRLDENYALVVIEGDSESK